MYDLGEQFKTDYEKAMANPSSIIKDTNSKYRFTLITDSLIRIEYSENVYFLINQQNLFGIEIMKNQIFK